VPSTCDMLCSCYPHVGPVYRDTGCDTLLAAAAALQKVLDKPVIEYQSAKEQTKRVRQLRGAWCC
jgi:hypothetical protein